MPAGDVDTGFVVARDGGTDVGRRDTSVDAAVSDIDAAFTPGACEFDMTSDYFVLDVDPRAHPGRIAMAAGPTSFGVVYSKDDGVGGENVFFVEVPSTTGAPSDPLHVTRGAFVNTSPVVARTSAGWLVAWLSQRDIDWEVYALGSGADGQFLTDAVRITSTDAIDEQLPGLASDGTINAIAWLEPSATPAMLVQAIGVDGMPSGVANRLSPAGVAIAPTSFTTSSGGYLVGWGDANGDAEIQGLNADGTAIGAPAALTTEHNTDGTIDAMIASLGGGAVVFGTTPVAGRHDVHAHLVDDMGQPILVEHVLTIGASTGTDASITGIGGGYAVSYRQAGTPPMLRILFLDSLLNEIGRSDLVEVAASGPTMIRTSADGNLLLTWADVIDTTTMVRGLRVRCH